jgi:hypothetical protein
MGLEDEEYDITNLIMDIQKMSRVKRAIVFDVLLSICEGQEISVNNLTALRRLATYEMLLRDSDLMNPSLSEDERLRRAEHLLSTYKRLRNSRPDFRENNEQLKTARRIAQTAQSGRQAAKLLTAGQM